MTYGTSRAEWYGNVPRSARSQTLFGYSLLGLAAVGFGYWANTAPIAGAVVAPGVFVATGQNKVVQHLEGGVIRDIFVREGDLVQADQLLIQLDETTPKAELRRLVLRHARLAAIEARLKAEAEEAADILFPQELQDMNGDSDIATMISNQRLTFKARRSSLQSEIATLNEGINALEQRVEGTNLQVAGVRRQLEFLREELDAKISLLAGGMIKKSDVLSLQRMKANLEGEIGRLTGELGNAREQIARTREQIIGVRKVAVKTAVEQLHETRADLNDVRERINSARSMLERTRITAPVGGVIVKMRYHTSGGVIEASKNILEIVPVQEELIIEVRVRPQDIESVKRGQNASVRLVALNRRVTPMIEGEVIYVSADALPNEKAGQQATGDIYVARVKLRPGELAGVAEFTPTPGMPVEVYIKTADRTFLDYLLRPLKDSMSRAFRES